MKLFSKKERWILTGFIGAGLIGALFFAFNYNQVSPSASLQFQVSRSEAKNLAEDFLTKNGLSVSGFEDSIIFISDQDEAVYLQKTLGTRLANEYFDSEYAPWYWKIRRFRYLEKEEFAVAISPNGQIVGFHHLIPEDEKGVGALSENEATLMAKEYLSDQIGVNWEEWALISYEHKDKEKRRDHYFKWAKIGTPFKEGKLILACGMRGNQFYSFSKYILVPSSFTSQVKEGDAKRNLLTLIFKLFYLALGVFVGAEFLLSIKRHLTHWKIPLILALTMFFLSLASELNSLTISWSLFDTRESFSHFVLTEFISSVIGAFWSGLFVLMVAVAAENYQKWTWPEKPGLSQLFSKNYFFSKSFIGAIVVGYSLGALQLGYVAAYYLFSQRFLGGWSPLESPYYNVASSFIPWIFPLTVGLSAALNEELFFRMFSISFLKKWFSSTILAVGIPALIWGFLHSNYYVEPIYSRGIELALVGIVFGLVYLKWGVVPVILTHYVYNSVLGFIPLLRSESLFFKASGWISLFWILLPALLAIMAYFAIKKRKSSGEFVLPPEEEKVPVQHVKESFVFRWGNRLGFEFFGAAEKPKKEKVVFPLEKSLLSQKTFLRTGVVLFVLLLLFWWFLPPFYGSSPQLKVGKGEVARLADTFIENQEIENPLENKMVVFFREPHVSVGTFLLREKSVEEANRILEQEQTSFLQWGVVYSKKGDPQGITLLVDAKGRVVGLKTIRKDEEPLGGALPVSEARLKAEDFFKQQRPLDWEQFQFVGVKTAWVKNRSSHAFIWEKKIPESPKLISRIKILIRGAQLDGYEEGIIAPENFLRELKEKKGGEALQKGIMALLVLVGSILVALDAIFKFRRGEYAWAVAYKIGLVYLICDVVEKINGFPQIWLSIIEKKSLSPGLLLFEKILNLFISELITFGFVVFFSAFALALIQEKFGSFSFSSLFSPRNWGDNLHRQGAILAILLFPVLWLSQQYVSLFEAMRVPQSIRASYPFFQDHALNTYWPFLTMIASGLKNALLFSLTLGGLLAFLLKIFKRPLFVFLFILFTSTFQTFLSSQYSWSESATQFGLQFLLLGILFLLLKHLVRWNLFFFLIFFWVRSLFDALPLLGSSDPFLLGHGALALLLILLPLLIPLLTPYLKRA